jgi:hypothetical protein
MVLHGGTQCDFLSSESGLPVSTCRKKLINKEIALQSQGEKGDKG